MPGPKPSFSAVFTQLLRDASRLMSIADTEQQAVAASDLAAQISNLYNLWIKVARQQEDNLDNAFKRLLEPIDQPGNSDELPNSGE